MNYFCSVCRRPTEPELSGVGVSAACCYESPLWIEDDGSESFRVTEIYPSARTMRLRPLTRFELSELIGELAADEDPVSPANRAHRRIMGGP
jgi:hypothetical protein